MKLSSITLAALALVAGTQARVCERTSCSIAGKTNEADCEAAVDNEVNGVWTVNWKKADDSQSTAGSKCESGYLIREFVPSDISEVSVEVEKEATATDGSKSYSVISAFSLSNAGGQDQASGSLDNIEVGNYRVNVKAKVSSSDKIFYVAGSKCSSGDVANGVIFVGSSSVVNIDGTGKSKKVTIFMSSCHPEINYEANGVTRPTFPPYTTTVEIESDSQVLGANGEASITIKLANPNKNGFVDTGVKAASSAIGYESNVHEWNLMSMEPGQCSITGKTSRADCEAAVVNGVNGVWTEKKENFKTGDKYVVELPSDPHSVGDSTFTIKFNSKDAQTTYTTTAVITPFVYDNAKDDPSNRDDDTGFLTNAPQGGSSVQGSPTSVDLIVAPVGDLDLEIIYFSGLRVNTEGITIEMSSPEDRTSSSVFKRKTAYCHAKNTNFPYVIPAGKVAGQNGITEYDIDYTATSLFGLQRTIEIEVESQTCNDNVVEISTVSGNGVVNAWGNDAVVTSDKKKITKTIKKSSLDVQLAELSFPVRVKILVEGTASNQVVDYSSECTLTLKTTTKGGGKTRASTQSLRYVVVPHKQLCEDFEAFQSTVVKLTQAQCPLLKTIMWQSTDHWATSPACSDTNTGAADHEIKFCAVTTRETSVARTSSNFWLSIVDTTADNGKKQDFKKNDAKFDVQVKDIARGTCTIDEGQFAYSTQITRFNEDDCHAQRGVCRRTLCEDKNGIQKTDWKTGQTGAASTLEGNCEAPTGYTYHPEKKTCEEDYTLQQDKCVKNDDDGNVVEKVATTVAAKCLNDDDEAFVGWNSATDNEYDCITKYEYKPHYTYAYASSARTVYTYTAEEKTCEEDYTLQQDKCVKNDDGTVVEKVATTVPAKCQRSGGVDKSGWSSGDSREKCELTCGVDADTQTFLAGGSNWAWSSLAEHAETGNHFHGGPIGTSSPCFETSQLASYKASNSIMRAQEVIFKIKPGAFHSSTLINGICDEETTAKWGARIRSDDLVIDNIESQGTATICSDIIERKSYQGDIAGRTIFCPVNKVVTTDSTTGVVTKEECKAPAKTAAVGGSNRKRRSLLQASSVGCPTNSPFTCPSANAMPFDIKVEDGRLTVSMDTKALGDKTVVINTNPQGLSPKRSRFIASDFTAASNSWAASLRAKLDFVFQDANMRQNLKPGATAQSLVACCGFSQAEAESLEAAMSSIVKAEDAQVFKPTITVSGNTGSTSNQQHQTTSTQTTSTHTTEKSSDDSSSGGSLLVVVAVAAVLVLVAVIALAIFTVKSNKQSQRVVDLRGGNDKQSSWQKGGAMESDF